LKLPKITRRYCPYCKRHTEHKVLQNKKRNPSPFTYGSKVRAKRRGGSRGLGNKGRYSKPAVTQFKMTGAKTTKKTDLRYECKECKKTHVQRTGLRAKKVELK
jgi:large subunit ribosomal protein L44e